MVLWGEARALVLTVGRGEGRGRRGVVVERRGVNGWVGLVGWGGVLGEGQRNMGLQKEGEARRGENGMQRGRQREAGRGRANEALARSRASARERARRSKLF